MARTYEDLVIEVTNEILSKCKIDLVDAEAGFIVVADASIEIALKVIEENRLKVVDIKDSPYYWTNPNTTYYVLATNESNKDKYGFIDTDSLKEIPGVVYG